MENNQEKTYIINGEEVDPYGEPTKTKKTNKAISILLAVALAGTLSVGVAMASNGVVRLLEPKDDIVITVTNPNENKDQYEVLLSDGTRILATKENIIDSISNQDNICVNGVYYSNTEDRLIHLEAQYTSKYVVEPVKNGDTYVAPVGYTLEGNKAVKYVTKKTYYLLTPEEYTNNLEEILSQNGEVKNYSAKLVESKPLSELYEMLGVEQPKTNKLTK